MARVGDGAQMANSLNNLTDVLFRYAMLKDQRKREEDEKKLREAMRYQDNARWTAQDTDRRERANIAEANAADRTRREDERWQATRDRYKANDEYNRNKDEMDRLYRESQDAGNNAYKYDALAAKLQSEAAASKNILPQPFEVNAGDRKYSGLYNPQTGAYDLDKPAKKPMVTITEPGSTPNSTVRRTVDEGEYSQQQLVNRPQEDKYATLKAAMSADPEYGATMRAKRMQAPTQPTGTGAFAPPTNAATSGAGMGNMDKAAILMEAAKAIQAGKDPAAVRKRLEEMGIQYPQ